MAPMPSRWLQRLPSPQPLHLAGLVGLLVELVGILLELLLAHPLLAPLGLPPRIASVQGYLAHKKPPPPRTLQ